MIALKRRVVATERAQEQTADDVRSLSLAEEVPDLGEIRKELSEQLQRWSELPDHPHYAIAARRVILQAERELRSLKGPPELRVSPY